MKSPVTPALTSNNGSVECPAGEALFASRLLGISFSVLHRILPIVKMKTDSISLPFTPIGNIKVNDFPNCSRIFCRMRLSPVHNSHRTRCFLDGKMCTEVLMSERERIPFFLIGKSVAVPILVDPVRLRRACASGGRSFQCQNEYKTIEKI